MFETRKAVHLRRAQAPGPRENVNHMQTVMYISTLTFYSKLYVQELEQRLRSVESHIGRQLSPQQVVVEPNQALNKECDESHMNRSHAGEDLQQCIEIVQSH